MFGGSSGGDGKGIRAHIDLTSEDGDNAPVRPYRREIDEGTTTSQYFGPSRAVAATAGDSRSKDDYPHKPLGRGTLTHTSPEVTAADLVSNAMKRVEASRRFRKSLNPSRKIAEGLIRKVKKPEIDLSPKQTRVLQLFLEGKNVFFTGPAGTGKSLVLEHVKYHLFKLNKTYAITAPTGVAAAQLGGSTINSFSGVGLGDKGLKEYLGMSTTGRTKIGERRGSWISTKVLIIDEISMVRDHLLGC